MIAESGQPHIVQMEKEKYGVLDLTGSAARCVAGSAHGSNAS